MRPATKRAPSGAQARTVRTGSTRPTNSRAPSSSSSQISRHIATALSPTNSVASGIASRVRSPVAGTKRKERDFELEGEETNIHVVVRCRGRNDREVRENSGVVVSTEGARGKTVDLSMGPNALSNKTYRFDKVFSPAADQPMIYDDVVAPILNDMISGYNCTIFAYGQTGTGKTYTMSGDMTDTFGLLSDAAGIIPRTLYSLFGKLDADEIEYAVKVSFIELYNEELRDLLSSDDSIKLKLYDADQKKGHSATVVQGMEESHIKSAQEGIRLLQIGSHRRQVAATKCNDLSSRSHTVFTMTVYTKRANSGEDWIVSGKLNLVDLAGSENIQRSGAENKRAAEAGSINRSLLTLGRVINALVDKAQHVPYRESKLTRLLQDSLGGRTKTCIIATISPARSNLEETISTLDYAFRAKNIRNKPQINQPIQKKTLLKEYTAEIQQLKSELIATRQRNGVYLSNDHYEQITVESESRRILSEEQRAKIETMEANLRNKVQDLFHLTNNLAISKKENEATRQYLKDANDVLRQTEVVLADTKQNLKEETILRKAHQLTEEELSQQGTKLISTLNRSVEDVNDLRAKIRRKSDMQMVNRVNWKASQAQVIHVSNLVEGRVEQFRESQGQLASSFTTRFQSFMQAELEQIASREKSLIATAESFKIDCNLINHQSGEGLSDMNAVLEEIKGLREDVKIRVGAGLQDLSSAAGRISAGIMEELAIFHNQLNNSYRSLGKDMKAVFDELNRRLKSQKLEAETLRQQLLLATQAAQESNDHLSIRLEESLEKERTQASTDRQALISQISDLINTNGIAQDERMKTRVHAVRGELQVGKQVLHTAETHYKSSMNEWLENGTSICEHVLKSRDDLKRKLQCDWEAVEHQGKMIEDTTRSIHGETVRVVEAQVNNMAVQMQSLDDLVGYAKSQNERYHTSQDKIIEKVALDTTEAHYVTAKNMATSTQTITTLINDLASHEREVAELTNSLVSSTQQPLSELRETITSTNLQEYTSTGSTPPKKIYMYSKSLAKTAPHAQILGQTQQQEDDALIIPVPDLLDSTTPPSPSKSMIYTDTNTNQIPSGANEEPPLILPRPKTTSTSSSASSLDSLREIPVNLSSKSSTTISSSLSSSTDRRREKEYINPLTRGLSSSLMGPPPAPGPPPGSLRRMFSSDTKPATMTRGQTARQFHDGRENHIIPTAAGGSAGSGSVGGKLLGIGLSASLGSGSGSGSGTGLAGGRKRRLRSAGRVE